MENHAYGLHLVDLPGRLPLYLSRFEADVSFTPSHLGNVDRQVINDAFDELDALVRSGFFTWACMDECASARIAVEWRDDGFRVLGEGAGLHHNILVVVLRMIVSLHQTPEQARQELVAALGSDADALPPRLVWFEQIHDIRLRRLDSADDRTVDRANLDSFVLDDQIGLPQSGIEDMSSEHQGERLIVRAKDRSAILSKAALASLEDDFLRVCNSGGFRSLSRLDEMPEEGEFFVRTGNQGMELVIDNYRDDRYGLVELLNAMTKGRSAALVVSEG